MVDQLIIVSLVAVNKAAINGHATNKPIDHIVTIIVFIVIILNSALRTRHKLELSIFFFNLPGFFESLALDTLRNEKLPNNDESSIQTPRYSTWYI